MTDLIGDLLRKISKIVNGKRTYFGNRNEFLLRYFFRSCLINFRPFLWHKGFYGFKFLPILVILHACKRNCSIWPLVMDLTQDGSQSGHLRSKMVFQSQSCISINGFSSLFGNNRLLHPKTIPTKLNQKIKTLRKI